MTDVSANEMPLIKDRLPPWTWHSHLDGFDVASWGDWDCRVTETSDGRYDWRVSYHDPIAGIEVRGMGNTKRREIARWQCRTTVQRLRYGWPACGQTGNPGEWMSPRAREANGLAWCSACHRNLPVDEFTPLERDADGNPTKLSGFCRPCKRIHGRWWYHRRRGNTSETWRDWLLRHLPHP